MAIHDTFPVDINDGDQLDDGFFNESKTMAINSNSSTEDTTEYSAAFTNSWTDFGYSKTFTPSKGTNSIIRGLKLVFDVKTASNASSDGFPGFAVRAKLTNNTNSEVCYFYNNISSRRDSTSNDTNRLQSLGPGYTGTSYSTKTEYSQAMEVNSTGGANDVEYAYQADHFGALIGGATYTLTLEFSPREYNPAPSDTAYIKDITATIYWHLLLDDEVTGWS